ncbi:MAG TPA: hypothetical protein V6D23_28165 [Candidatus Obscuribacterales bacterium]
MKTRICALLSLLLLGACGGRVPANIGASTQAVILSPTKNAFYVFDLRTNRVSYQIKTGMQPQDLVLGDGGLVFISHAQESSFSVFQRVDPWIWSKVGKVGTSDQPGRLIYSHPFQELYVAAANAPRLGVYRVSGLRRPVQQQIIRLDAKLTKPTALALSADGSSLYVAGEVLQSLSRANEKLSPGQTLSLPEHAEISDMLLAGSNLLLVDRGNDQILVVDTGSFKQTATIKLGEGLESPVLPARIALNHAGTKAYLTGSGASVVQVIDVKNLKLLETLKLNHSGLRHPAEAPLGVAVLGNDREVYVTAQSGRNLAIIEASPSLEQSDKINRTLGTTVHEALLPPLGAIEIF